jgi:4,5-DOPA dioxygenase extradiol
MIRPLFVSHGAPTLPFEAAPARDFLSGLAALQPRPRAILMISAHWDTRTPMVNAVARNAAIHDFSGFPEALYRLSYPAPGSPELAEQAADLLSVAGLAVGIDRRRGLDHGAWVPLMLAWPEADIPVMQLSVQSHLGSGHHLEVGRALAPLAGQGVQIIGSGSFTHDLSGWRGHAGAPEPEYVSAFAHWFHEALAGGRMADLLAWRRLAPFAARNHPTEEHLLPLFVALGAGGAGPAQRLHASLTYSVLRMDAYAFGS